MKAVIKLDVPEWQIGKVVTVYFPDTMEQHAICEEEPITGIFQDGTDDRKLCAEGLRRFLSNNSLSLKLSFKEMCVFYGAISLLYGCSSEEWLSKPTDEYDNWDPFKGGV